MSTFRLTYSTMFDPPEALHRHFDDALAAVRATLGAEHAMWFGGADARAARQFAVHGPIDRRVVLGRFHPAGWVLSILGALVLLYAYLNFAR